MASLMAGFTGSLMVLLFPFPMPILAGPIKALMPAFLLFMIPVLMYPRNWAPSCMSVSLNMMLVRAAVKAAGLGGSNGVCFNHEPFNTALLDRCQGFADGMGESLNMVEVSRDFDDIKNTVIAYMTSNPNTGAIMAVGPTGCDPTIAALEEMGMNGKIILGCFDLGPQIVDGIVNGTVPAIDQQRSAGLCLLLSCPDHRNGTLPGNSIRSGPVL